MNTLYDFLGQSWEFIKEKKKVRKQENTHSSKKTRTRPRKKELGQENTQLSKKASTKKRSTKKVVLISRIDKSYKVVDSKID